MLKTHLSCALTRGGKRLNESGGEPFKHTHHTPNAHTDTHTFTQKRGIERRDGEEEQRNCI